MEIVINSLPDERWKDYRSLRLKALSHEPVAFGSSYEEEVLFGEDVWKARMADGLYATEGDTVAGMIGVVFNSRIKTRHVASIVSFYVDPVYRGRGIGQKLMDAAIEKIKSRGNIAKVELSVNPLQDRAVRLYEMKGFRVTGRQSKELCVNGVYYDELYMEMVF